MYIVNVKHKYKVGDKVYVMTKNGVEQGEIKDVVVYINPNSKEIIYRVAAQSVSYESYYEAQIIPLNRHEVSKKLKEIEQQLPLLLE